MLDGANGRVLLCTSQLTLALSICGHGPVYATYVFSEFKGCYPKSLRFNVKFAIFYVLCVI